MPTTIGTAPVAEQERKADLLNDLRSNVNQYFKERGLSKNANATMVSKTIILFAVYFIPYALIITNSVPIGVMWALTVVMGVAMAGIGMSIMHDACHGAYSSKPKMNRLLAYSMNLLGGSKFNWSIQHNLKHHTNPNVFGEDEDLDNGNLIRLSPYSKWYSYHRFQHFYSWFLYLLGTLSWATIKDFKQLIHLSKTYKEPKGTSYRMEMVILVTTKIMYWAYIFVVPLLLLDIAVWQLAIGFLTMHVVASFILSVTFQLAHIVEIADHVDIETTKRTKDPWAVHQIKTTANFCRRNKFLNWYLGGLNYQVEHHLFPNICHVHYHEISEIVRQTVIQHGHDYREYDTLGKAVSSHYRELKRFSRPTVLSSSN